MVEDTFLVAFIEGESLTEYQLFKNLLPASTIQAQPLAQHQSDQPCLHLQIPMSLFLHSPSPLLTIINRLASASPNTMFSFFSSAQSNNSIFSTFQPTQSNIKAYNVHDGVPEGYVFVGKPQEDIELFMKGAPKNFRKGMELAMADCGRKVSCLVTDAFFWFAKEMAAENGVPWLAFWTAGPCSLSSHVYTDLIREKFGVRMELVSKMDLPTSVNVNYTDIVGREDETLNFIPGMSNVRIHDLPEGILFRNLDSLFSRMLHQMGQVLPDADAVFINSFEELDPVMTNDLKSKFKQHLNVGLFILATLSSSVPDSYGCLTWLDKQKPASVAYISFGSVAIPPPNELLAVAEALEATKVPFIWSLRDKLKVHLPNGFLDKANGMVVPWAPQKDVLAHGAVGVFITHGGWNSRVESIAGGVPTIFRPFFGDHRVNRRMVEDVWETGVIVKNGVLTKNGIISSLDLVLAREKGKKMRENLRKLKKLPKRPLEQKGALLKISRNCWI